MPHTLPVYELTEICDPDAKDSRRITLLNGVEYFVHPVKGGIKVNYFPIITDSRSVPWPEATLWLLYRLENAVESNITTIAGLAVDLSMYRVWLDETGVEWLHFPQNKRFRPTYRYNAHLLSLIQANEISPSTASQRINTVLGFYSWLMDNRYARLENSPWVVRDKFVQYKDAKGFAQSKTVKSTDLAIPVAKVDPIMHGVIDDGGKLRPMSKQEQEWLVDALLKLGNTEMTLIHLIALLTGARIQTVLTIRVKHVMAEQAGASEVRLIAGPGTGIDTKNNKRNILFIPIYLYERVRTYAMSQRAKLRRERAKGGDTPDQYLFLSNRGMPFYQSKADLRTFDEGNKSRNIKRGETVRVFIQERVIPYIRTNYGVPSFRYQFHDTRATFGMNLTEAQLAKVEAGMMTLFEAREHVKARMNHESATTTDRYLQFKHALKFIREINDEYAAHLRSRIESLSIDTPHV